MHTHIHIHSSHLTPKTPKEKKSTFHSNTAHQVIHVQKGEGWDHIHNGIPCPLSPRTWCDPRVTPDAWEPSPRVVKAVSLLMHLPLLPIHFKHAQSSFLALQIFLFHSVLFSHRPSIPFVAFLSTQHLSQWIILFSSPTSPPFSPCVQTTSTHSAMLNQHLFLSHSAQMFYSTHTSKTSPLYLMAKNVHQLKEKLDKYRYGNRTTRE